MHNKNYNMPVINWNFWMWFLNCEWFHGLMSEWTSYTQLSAIFSGFNQYLCRNETINGCDKLICAINVSFCSNWPIKTGFSMQQIPMNKKCPLKNVERQSLRGFQSKFCDFPLNMLKRISCFNSKTEGKKTLKSWVKNWKHK